MDGLLGTSVWRGSYSRSAPFAPSRGISGLRARGEVELWEDGDGAASVQDDRAAGDEVEGGRAHEHDHVRDLGLGDEALDAPAPHAACLVRRPPLRPPPP